MAGQAKISPEELLQSLVDTLLPIFEIPHVIVRVANDRSFRTPDVVAFWGGWRRRTARKPIGEMVVRSAHYDGAKVPELINTLKHELIHAWVDWYNLEREIAGGHGEPFIKKAIELDVDIASTIAHYPESKAIYNRLTGFRPPPPPPPVTRRPSWTSTPTIEIPKRRWDVGDIVEQGLGILVFACMSGGPIGLALAAPTWGAWGWLGSVLALSFAGVILQAVVSAAWEEREKNFGGFIAGATVFVAIAFAAGWWTWSSGREVDNDAQVSQSAQAREWVGKITDKIKVRTLQVKAHEVVTIEHHAPPQTIAAAFSESGRGFWVANQMSLKVGEDGVLMLWADRNRPGEYEVRVKRE
jgi:hypothetical protein